MAGMVPSWVARVDVNVMETVDYRSGIWLALLRAACVGVDVEEVEHGFSMKEADREIVELRASGLSYRGTLLTELIAWTAGMRESRG